MDAKQQELAFGPAEGVHRDRRRQVRAAARACGADAHGLLFVQAVFDFGRPLQLSYDELGRLELVCSASKAKLTVQWALGHHLVAAEPWRPGDASRANRYSIDWLGVRRALGLGPVADDQSHGDQSRGDQSRGDQSRGDQSRGDQSPGAPQGEPGGETPRAGAAATKDVRSLRSSLDLQETTTLTNERTNVVAPARKEIAASEEIRALCFQAADLLAPPPRHPLGPHQQDLIVRLARVAIEHYDAELLVSACREAAKRGHAIHRRIEYARGVMANQSGNRDLFLTRLDACRSPPARREP